MRRVVCTELGPPEKLIVEEGDDLEPRPGQVVVAVRAAGVNFVDGLFISGGYQIKPPLPFTPGSEIAGEVVAAADDVESLRVGDPVFAMCGLGGYAEQVAISALQAVPMPPALDYGQAATFVQSYCTALFALRERAGLIVGETVLVLGAGGGVGLATIDVAKALGATVLAAASSPSKLAAASAARADHVIDYSYESVKDRARELTGGDGVDVVLDPIGGDQADPSLRALRLFGRYVVIGFASGTIPRLPLNQVLLRNRSIIGVDWGAWSMQQPGANNELVSELLAMISDGVLSPARPTTYGLEDAGRALDDLLHRRVVGKVALVP
ncbi:MAG: NADPH:quinone oxidoreductase family protein [Actinobacteria bacterium]|nr:NADPH:quinone oxidoreductase family protein [Actinomycetota bacterium]